MEGIVVLRGFWNKAVVTILIVFITRAPRHVFSLLLLLLSKVYVDLKCYEVVEMGWERMVGR